MLSQVCGQKAGVRTELPAAIPWKLALGRSSRSSQCGGSCTVFRLGVCDSSLVDPCFHNPMTWVAVAQIHAVEILVDSCSMW